MLSTPSRSLPVFLAATIRSPMLIGACFPSSRSLGRLLTDIVPRSGAPTVAELGAGTGAVSRAIAERLPPRGRHVAVEIEPFLAAHLRRTQPGVVVLEGDAAELTSLLATVSVTHVDAVVSGLPWSLFPAAHQRRILVEIAQTLAPTGAFSTFSYRHAEGLAGARRFRLLLREYFDEVVVSRTVWRNLPPAFAYVCRRPVV